jgi:hypothetical protein
MMLIGATKAMAKGKYNIPTENRDTKENIKRPTRPAHVIAVRFLTNPNATTLPITRGIPAAGTCMKLVPDCCVWTHGFPLEHDSDTEAYDMGSPTTIRKTESPEIAINKHSATLDILSCGNNKDP